MTDSLTPWFAIQLGARENYAIARALHRAGNLDALISDSWQPHPPIYTTLLGERFRKKISDRYSQELANASVNAFNLSSLRFELEQQIKGRSGWPLMIARNQWFQKKTVD